MPGTEIGPAAPAVGFFGKIPARGDFVRAGLARAFTDPWDSWLQAALAGSREVLGARWLPAWMEAPVWHFALPEGQCGPAPVLGVWMPSIDAAGRHFPLTLAHVGPWPAHPGAWLAGAEACGLAALQDDLEPEALVRRLAGPFGAAAGEEPELPAGEVALWWTEGSPFVPAGRFTLATLPDAARFARMLFAEAGGGCNAQPDAAADGGGVRG